MTVQSAMTYVFEVWTRDTEAATWLRTHRGLRGSLIELTPDGARRQSAGAGVQEPDVSHVVRMGAEAVDFITGGLRLRNQADGAEYVVRVPRWRSRPPPGNLKVTVAAVPAATQG